MGKTSSTVKNRYNSKMYAQINVKLPKELVSKWENKIKADGISKAEFIRTAIMDYLKTAGE